MLALRTLEFDRIVDAVTALALTPLGTAALAELEPSTDPRVVVAAQEATSETVRFLERHPLFPLRAGEGLPDALASLAMTGRPLEPLQLRMLADFVDSVDQAGVSVRRAGADFPILAKLAAHVASFTDEVATVRHAIDPGGEVLDHASPELKRIRNELRQKRQKLRGTLEQFTRGSLAKYLQEEIVTERNGRFVLMVRAEHRGNVPGIVHGSSTTGATLFMEPAATVEINNDIVELEDREREEIFRILLELTDRFRARPDDLAVIEEVARDLDTLQAKARYSSKVNGIAPAFTADTSLELKGARHPLVGRRVDFSEERSAKNQPGVVVPVDILLDPPNRVLLITGPNTGGKTVALKTAGLFALMAQAGLHLPAAVARLPVFRSVFADIGDEQSIENSLSTFSSHITNLVSMERDLQLPALVLLDEVGTGTDPNEGGALATAIVQHFRQRGALVMATTHFDSVKTWGIGTEGVAVAAFAFDPQNFAPTYRLIYGAPGRSLAIEMAQRLGMPQAVIAAARGYLSDDQKRLQAHLSRLDAQARALEADRIRLERERRTFNETNAALSQREKSLAEREEVFKKRLNERLDERLRQARRDVDAVIDQLKEKSEALAEKASLRAVINTGESGAAKAGARAEIDRIVEDLRHPAAPGSDPEPRGAEGSEPVVGARVTVGGLGLEGTVVAIDGNRVEIDVRGKRIQAKVKELRVIGKASGGVGGGNPSGLPVKGKVRVNVDLKPREGMLSELKVIGMTVDEAIDRVSRFLDDTLVTDVSQVRIVHGHGTGALRKGLGAFLKTHPLVEKHYPAPDNQGGGGATIVELKD
ncbi:MAG: endonuclease MutS2 [Acidobacteriota bacterium]|nr:endonuclease MutS2 [Acidobacteriota bacterium]